MNNGNPPNLPLNRLTNPSSIYGTALQQLQQQVPLSSLLNLGSQTQQEPQQSPLQVLRALLQPQAQQQPQQQAQQPVQNQIDQAILQALGQRTTQQQQQPLHLGLLQNVNGLSPSSLSGLSPDLQSQLIRSLASGSNSAQNTDLLLAIEKQNILDRARALNQLEIRRALEREQEQHQTSSNAAVAAAAAALQRNSRASASATAAPAPAAPAPQALTQIPANLRSILEAALNQQQQQQQQASLAQPLQVDAIARALTTAAATPSTSTNEAPSEASSGDTTSSALPFNVGEGGVKDLRMVQDSTWESRFRDLMQFKLDHGHCNVPRRYKANPKLGVWVCSLRQQMTRGTLNKAKVERLNQIGFQWRITVIKGGQINPQIVKMDKWNENFMLLSKIKSETGSCKVPSTNRKLGKWVYKQRREMAKGKLALEKQEKLNSIGFQWKPDKATKNAPADQQEEGSDDWDDDYVKISDSDDADNDKAVASVNV